MNEHENSLLLLGEIKGKLGELVHSVNNVAGKQDALAFRVEALERDRAGRDGANGVLHAIFKSPAVAWLISAAVTAYFFITGRPG